MNADALREADSAAADLLLLYEHLGVQAIFIQLVDGVILVRCQEKEHVLPLCKQVTRQYEIPEERSLN